MFFGTLLEFLCEILVMRFYIGILSVITSIIILAGSILLLNFSYLFEKFVAMILFAIAGFLIISGVHNLTIFYQKRRIINNGYKTRAKIVKVQKTLLALKSAPNYILEVIYEHPQSHKNYQTFLDYYDEVSEGTNPNENQYIDILIDPDNPDIVVQKTI